MVSFDSVAFAELLAAFADQVALMAQAARA